MIGVGRRLSSDRGAVIVIVAAWMTSAIALVTFVIDVGHWYEHKRHLQVQVDAAAFAGGGKFAACFNNGGGNAAIFTEATKYAGAVGSWNGTSYGTAQYNAQIGESHKGTVSMLYQSATYADGTDPNDGTETQAPCQTPHYQFDVKGTESDVPLFFIGDSFVPAINAHARVQLQPLGATNPSLPLAAPDVNPRQVGITFVNEATGDELTGCSGTNLVGTSGCTFAMAKGTPVGALNIWSGPATVVLPTAPANVGVRIGLGGQVASCANTAGSRYYACFDGATNSQGLYLIRDFASGGTVSTAPIFNGVWPTTNATSCSGSPFFSDFQTGGADCPAGVQARVDFGTGATIPDSNYSLKVNVANADAGKTVIATMSPVAGSYNATSHTWLWQAANGSLSLDIGAGPEAITFDWTVNKGTSPICTGSNKDCKGTTSVLHRFYGAPTNDGSGPIQQLSVTEGGADAASLEGGTRSLNVTIGISGNFKVNKACPSPPGLSGSGYTCFTYDATANVGPDRAVLLRLKQDRGPNTYTIDCGGGNIRTMIENGCANAYSINAADICPDAGTPPTPPDCVPTQTGTATGQIRQGMNTRFAPGGTCLPNNYPNIPPGDRRVVIVMITDFSAFNGGGSITVPVVTYGAFYVVGWDGAPVSCDNEPYSHTGRGGSPGTGDVWGHFITYVDGAGSGTPGVCDPNALLPCVPVLTD